MPLWKIVPQIRSRRLCKSGELSLKFKLEKKLGWPSLKCFQYFHPVLKGHHFGAFTRNLKRISRLSLVFPMLTLMGIDHLWHLNKFLIHRREVPQMPSLEDLF